MAFKRSVTPAEAIDLLNEALRLDPEAISALVLHRAPCNDALGNHPAIQVGCHTGECSVGLVGILNGLFGVDDQTGWGAIVAEVAGDRVMRFYETPIPAKEAPR